MLRQVLLDARAEAEVGPSASRITAADRAGRGSATSRPPRAAPIIWASTMFAFGPRREQAQQRAVALGPGLPDTRSSMQRPSPGAPGLDLVVRSEAR